MTNEQHATKIMKLVNDMADSEAIRATIISALQDTYKRGADSIRRSPNYNYKEDMGR